MINFPVFGQLDVTDYGLYPGKETSGLHIKFQAGLTLVLGANGLGKTTLVTIIYRLLTGPYDLRGQENSGPLGTTRLDSVPLSNSKRKVFGERVVDGAQKAKACLTFKLGKHTLLIERQLSDLALIRFSVDDNELTTASESVFQEMISTQAGVWSFGDWVLLLRHLIFYFEDRRALVWDASAQRQILRMLFLAPQVAEKWSKDERAILELDSRMRNLRATAYSEEVTLTRNEKKSQSGMEIREELQTLEDLQSHDVMRRSLLDNERLERQTQRDDARLKFLKAQQERESYYREVERARLIAIEHRFPKLSDTTQYILAQLITEEECLVCGNHAPQAAKIYLERMENRECVICGTPNSDVLVDSINIEREIDKAKSKFELAEVNLRESRRLLNEVEPKYSSCVLELQELNVSIGKRSANIDNLIDMLPPEEADLHKHRVELATLRSRVASLTEELTANREQFRAFIGSVSRDLAKSSEKIKTSFDEFARGFLLEECNLVWSLQKVALGQASGEPIEFPVYALDMTGANFPSPARRSGPEQVSESQREFIDLAFRMALIEVSGSGGSGSLVMDAPESSLDAVFVSRAATVLLRFANATEENRLLITSNLVEGALLPSLIEGSRGLSDSNSRIINLFEIATPTAAVRDLRAEYTKILEGLLKL